MYFGDDSEEKRLFEDIQFKRRVAFVDDDDVLHIELKPFSASTSRKADVRDRDCQVNIQNELVSSVTQTRSRKNREVQTDAKVEAHIESADSDIRRITKLFEKRTRLIEETIVQNNESKAFDNYDVDWSGGDATITSPFTLVNQQMLNEELHVVAVEWNSSGTTVCCAYGRFDHESVCTHRAALCTWNIDRLKIDVNKPDTSIETPCCISCMAAHPEYPSIIAVGLFSGDILVFDLRQADAPAATVTDKNEMHKDEVTVLKWIKDTKTSKKKYLLLSGSRDGKLLVWNALPAKNQLKLVEGYLMLVDNLPSRTHFKSLGTEMGVSALAISNEDKDTFMVGCDSGGLFKCSFSSKKVVHSKWDEDCPVELISPVELAFDPQYGPIYSISHSPFHRNLALTCGTDSEIRLYSLLETSSLASFCPDSGYLYSLSWSPTRPCVFACGSHKGSILIYDLAESSNALAACQVTKASDSAIYAISFNAQRPGYLASGDAKGVVRIWRLSQNLSRASAGDLKTLNDISQKPFEKN